jgi:hypothetical protein
MSANLSALSQLSEAEAFSHWLEVHGDWVEEPNVRRGGVSGVKRIYSDKGQMLYRKQQNGHTFRSLRHPFGYPTVMREREALLACSALGVAVPALIFAACRKAQGQWQALLVTEALDGYKSLEDCYAERHDLAWGEVLHLEIVQEFGRVLGRLNRGRWQHGCLRLKHVFVRVCGNKPEVALLDLEKSRRRFLASQAARHDLRQVQNRLLMSEPQWRSFIEGYRSTYGDFIPKISGQD